MPGFVYPRGMCVTVAPWVVVASLPFAPEIVIPTVRHFARSDLGMTGKYGFKPFLQPFATNIPPGWWVTPYHFGVDQGPVVLMIEDYRAFCGTSRAVGPSSFLDCCGRNSVTAG